MWIRYPAIGIISVGQICPPPGQNTTPDPGFFSVNPIVVDVDLGTWPLVLLELRYLDSP